MFRACRWVVSRRSAAAICLFMSALRGISGEAMQKPEAINGVRGLNSAVLQLVELLRSQPSAAAQIRRQAHEVLEIRASALESLLEQNPAEAIRVAFPQDVLSDIEDSFPGTRRHLETHGTWEGVIEYVIEDSVDFSTHRKIRSMSAGGETLYLHFAFAEPPGLKNGDLLRVSGVRAGSQVAAYDGGVTQAATGRPPQPAPCTTTGLQKSIVLLVSMPGAQFPTNVTPRCLEHVLQHGRRSALAHRLLGENSYGVTTGAGTLAPGTTRSSVKISARP